MPLNHYNIGDVNRWPGRKPYRNFKVQVEIMGVRVAGFNEVTGLSSESDIIEYREGQSLNSVRKLPGLTKYSGCRAEAGSL